MKKLTNLTTDSRRYVTNSTLLAKYKTCLITSRSAALDLICTDPHVQNPSSWSQLFLCDKPPHWFQPGNLVNACVYTFLVNLSILSTPLYRSSAGDTSQLYFPTLPQPHPQPSKPQRPPLHSRFLPAPTATSPQIDQSCPSARPPLGIPPWPPHPSVTPPTDPFSAHLLRPPINSSPLPNLVAPPQYAMAFVRPHSQS